MAVETAEGIVVKEPPQPRFSLKGRTPRSLLRLVDEWHHGLHLVSGGVTWAPSRLRPMILEIPRIPRKEPSTPTIWWELTELTNSDQLRDEGATLRHCVASYSARCCRGASRIWSLRLRRDAEARSVVTIEVDPRRDAIVQARTFRNRRPSGKTLRLIQTWAAREDLRLAI